MPVLHWGPTSVDKFLWNAVAGNNPMAVHNMTMKFEARLDPNLRPSIYPEAPMASKFITSQPSMVTLDLKDQENEFYRVAAWKPGSQPLAPYTPYNYNMVIRARKQQRYLRIAHWQRDLLFQNLMDQSIGFSLLAMLALPWIYLLAFRKPWVIERGSAPPSRTSVGGAVETKLLMEGPAALTHHLVHLDLLQAIQTHSITYHAKESSLRVQGKVSVLPPSLQKVFGPKTSLSLKEYQKLVRRQWNGIKQRAMTKLCQEGWYARSAIAIQRQYSYLCVWQSLVMVTMLAYPYLLRCARWWMTSNSLYMLFAFCFVTAWPGKFLLYPLTVAGARCAAGWHHYLQELRKEEEEGANTSQWEAYSFFGWGAFLRSKKEFQQWARAPLSSLEELMYR